MGNVIGSTISNILGAFSIGVLFQSEVTTFDRSLKMYTVILFVVTTFIRARGLFRPLGKIVDGLLIASFIIYISLVLWSVYLDVLAAPHGSDSDSDTDSEHDGGEYSEEIGMTTNADTSQSNADESSPLLPTPNKPRRSILYHFAKLSIGFLALIKWIYPFSSTLAPAFGLSESVWEPLCCRSPQRCPRILS